MNIKNPFRKKRKTVRFNSKENTARTISYETKQINRDLARDVKNEVWLRRNNEANNDAPSPEYGVNEIRPRLSKTKRKTHAIETLKKVNKNKNKSNSNSGCTICGGKASKTRRRRRYR